MPARAVCLPGGGWPLGALCELLPRLNFNDDPNLETMRNEVEQKLANLNKDVIVGNDTFRSQKIDEAKAIMDKMGVFMGGTQ